MQTNPVSRLPVDPSPRSSHSEAVDRGFADLLHDRTDRARPDDRPEPARKEAGAPAPERPAGPRDDADDAPVHTAGETPERDGKGSGADTATAETDTPEDGSAGAANEAPADDGKAVTDRFVGALATPPTPVDPSVAPATIQAVKDPAGAVAPSAGASPVVQDAGAAVGQNGAGDAPAAQTIQPVVPGVATDAAEAAAPAPATAGEEIPQVKKAGQPAIPAATDDGVGPAAAAQTAQPEGTAVPAAEQPAQAAGPVAAAAPPAPSAPIPAGSTRTATAAGASAKPATPATPFATEGEAADTAGTEGDGEARPAAATPAQTAKAPGSAPDAKPDFATGSNGAQKAPDQGAAQPSAPAAADVPATIAAPADRGADAPTQTRNSGLPHQTVSAAGEARAASSAPAQSDSAAPRAPANPAASQVAIHISRAVQDGQDRFTVNLKPAHLGRITVNLELGHDHRVIAVISADRPDTLDLLQRDARTLERALQDAGLKTDSGSLSFNLQGGGADRSPADDDRSAGRHAAYSHAEDTDDPLPVLANPYARAIDASGVDIHV